MNLKKGDFCSCGSGKRYKNCCLKDFLEHKALWKNNFLELTNDLPNAQKLRDVFYVTYDFMQDNNWVGACHTISTLQYILLCEIGLNPSLYTGVVQTEQGRFDHSWIELDDKVYDITIENSLVGKFSNATISSHDIMTLKSTSITYGNNGPLDPVASKIVSTPITKYLNDFSKSQEIKQLPFLKAGLWSVLIKLGKDIGLKLDTKELQNKYANIYRLTK